MASTMRVHMVSGEYHTVLLDQAAKDKTPEQCADEWFDYIHLGDLATLKLGSRILVVRNIEAIVFQ